MVAIMALALVPATMAAGTEPLRGQWHLEDPGCIDAPCIHPDSSGNGLTATAPNTLQLVPGRFGSGQHMTSKSSILSAGNQPLLKPEKATVVAWVRKSGTPGQVQGIVSQGAQAGCAYSSYALYTGGSSVAAGLRFYIFNGTTLFITPPASNAMWDGQWHMTAGTFDGTAVRLYVDGKLAGEAPASGSIGYGLSANDNFVIGNGADPFGCIEQTQFSGDVDEARLYSRALTATEIARMAAATGPTPPDLVPDGGPPSSPPPTGGAGGAVAVAAPAGVSKQLTAESASAPRRPCRARAAS